MTTTITTYNFLDDVKNNNIEAVKRYIISGGNINMQDKSYNTPLMLASISGYDALALLLIQHGGYTALMDASMYNHPKIVFNLIMTGAELNWKWLNANTIAPL
jgi:ankyrin repeat protein